MQIDTSILISSYNRLHLLKRTLFSIARNKPNIPFEVVLADDGSTQDIIGVLHLFDGVFPWKFIKVDISILAEKGIEKFHNNPSLTNNVAFSNSSGLSVFLMGNECIAWNDCFNQMLKEVKQFNSEDYLAFSTTYDIPQDKLNLLDEFGTNINEELVNSCKNRVLASSNYCSDVTNYLSLCSRNLWQKIGGYDERYLSGVACEDSDFVRRARKISNFKLFRSNSISLHQFHNGMSPFSKPTERGMNEEKWNIGLKINRNLYNNWDETCYNRQPWIPGLIGIKEIIQNGY